jgi:hypothetical protein
MALLLAVLAIAAAGCGGSEVAADEVPGAPPALTVPTDEDLGGGGNADNASSDDGNASGDDADADANADADSGADGTTDDTATPEATAEPPATDDTTGGTTTPETTAPEDTATNDTPPAGSEAEQFESFCEQNAGAC